MWSPDRAALTSSGRTPLARSRCQSSGMRATHPSRALHRKNLASDRLSGDRARPSLSFRLLSASQFSSCACRHRGSAAASLPSDDTYQDLLKPHFAAQSRPRRVLTPEIGTAYEHGQAREWANLGVVVSNRFMTDWALSGREKSWHLLHESQNTQHIRLLVDKVCDEMRGSSRRRKSWATAV